ncbi:hypothetical protein AIGOOFII_2839 [Methylobacterium marchantiae]|nr:hypothetical protein AIGOOFII_2839 [Methylobacterium marchantiae]
MAGLSPWTRNTCRFSRGRSEAPAVADFRAFWRMPLRTVGGDGSSNIVGLTTLPQ